MSRITHPAQNSAIPDSDRTFVLPRTKSDIRLYSLPFLRAYLKLIEFDGYLARGNFSALCQRVRQYPTRCGQRCEQSIDALCAAVDLASIFYWKEVLCLQRSAAATCLLRSCGVTACMVIGVRNFPFKAHAWVEVADLVVNDKPDFCATYSVLERC
jgi:hypothetical protein